MVGGVLGSIADYLTFLVAGSYSITIQPNKRVYTCFQGSLYSLVPQATLKGLGASLT